MAYCTLNGAEVVSAQIQMPRLGVWHADVAVNVDSGVAAGTRVQIAAAGQVWNGTVMRAGLSRGRLYVRVAGGFGGISTEVPPKAYRQVPLRVPLQDIMRATGEKLSTTADAGILSRILQKYAHAAQPGGLALASLLTTAGDDVMWRVLRDGTTWIGRESWKPRQVDLQILHDEPSLGRFHAYVLPELVPGDSVEGRKVSYVEHSIEDSQLRTRVWVEDT